MLYRPTNYTTQTGECEPCRWGDFVNCSSPKRTRAAPRAEPMRLLYPDAGHAFFFQEVEDFAGQVERFLAWGSPADNA